MAYKKITREMAMQAVECKTEEEKKKFEKEVLAKLSDGMLDEVNGGIVLEHDYWECDMCGARFDNFWDSAVHVMKHVPDLF